MWSSQSRNLQRTENIVVTVYVSRGESPISTLRTENYLGEVDPNRRNVRSESSEEALPRQLTAGVSRLTTS